VQQVSGDVSVFGNLTQILVSVGLSGFSSSGFITGFTAPPALIPDGSHPFNEKVLFYFEGGQFVTVFVALLGGATYAGGFEDQAVVLTGYAVDCTVANCAPVVH